MPNNPFLIVAAILPLVLTGYRIGLVAEAVAYGIIFLSYTLLTGQGGMISLCQITFAGVGAITAGQMATVYGWPVLVGVLLGAALAGLGGLIVGALTVRMGNLYVALATLTFGLLMSTLVFQLNRFFQFGAGVTVPRPDFAQSDMTLAYFTLAIFVIIRLAIAATRYSTPGLALSAMRSTETGARAAGINVFRMKIRAIGRRRGDRRHRWRHAGDLFGRGHSRLIRRDHRADLVRGVSLPTASGRTTPPSRRAWSSSTSPTSSSTYLPVRFGPVSTPLFGLGAVLLARNPDGVISMNGSQLAGLGRRLTRLECRRRGRGEPTDRRSSSLRRCEGGSVDE